jgi:GT2 family glycosyltransferase
MNGVLLMMKKLKQVLERRRFAGSARILRGSPLFDEEWYLSQYSDVGIEGQDPVLHYLKYGAEAGRDPSPNFDTSFYLGLYPDVCEAGVNPLIHFICHGQKEGRSPRSPDVVYATLNDSPLFDRAWYLDKNPDVCAKGDDPVRHYIEQGAREGRNPSPVFETGFYLLAYPDVAEADINPLYHFIAFGQSEGRSATLSEYQYETLSKSLLFNQEWYLNNHPELLESGCDPIRHYIDIGAREGWDPSPAFETLFYRNTYRDVGESGLNPLYHFLMIGQREGRAITASQHQFALIVSNRIRNIQSYRAEIKDFTERTRRDRIYCAIREPRIAIYTAIVDNYDSIKLPQYLDPRFDYVVFTNEPLCDTGIWAIRPIAFFDVDPTRTSRFIKTHPIQLLPDYDIAVWIDANILIIGDFFPLIEAFLKSGRGVAAVPHPLRQTIYQEVVACSKDERDRVDLMEHQVELYRNEGFEHADLIEANFLFFDLRQPNVGKFLEVWWRELDRFSKRDQLSINYALRMAGVEWFPLTEFPSSIRNHPNFLCLPHDAGSGAGQDLLDLLGFRFADPYKEKTYANHQDTGMAKSSGKSVDVVVCVHNALEYVIRCLESISRVRQQAYHKLIVIDDGSDALTRSYLDQFCAEREWVLLVRNVETVGYTKAANQGLRVATADIVILLNSDTIVTRGWIEKLAEALFSTPGAGIVGPLSNAASYQSIPDYRGRGEQTAINHLPAHLSPEEMNRLCELWTPATLLPYVPLIHGFCFGIKREVIDTIGFLDEDNFPRGYGEENDYCFRASDAGFLLVVATHTFVFHAKSKSYPDSTRIALMREASDALDRLHGAHRKLRAVESMEGNPILKQFRRYAAIAMCE